VTYSQLIFCINRSLYDRLVYFITKYLHVVQFHIYGVTWQNTKRRIWDKITLFLEAHQSKLWWHITLTHGHFFSTTLALFDTASQMLFMWHLKGQGNRNFDVNLPTVHIYSLLLQACYSSAQTDTVYTRFTQSYRTTHCWQYMGLLTNVTIW
jgi:hypothetical protein